MLPQVSRAHSDERRELTSLLSPTSLQQRSRSPSRALRNLQGIGPAQPTDFRRPPCRIPRSDASSNLCPLALVEVKKHPLLQLVLAVADGNGVIVTVQAVDQCLNRGLVDVAHV